MTEFKIKNVYPDPPKEWNNPKGGVIYYRTVDLEGHDKPVSIGKKDSHALKAGMSVWGDIIPTDFLEDKFKPSAPPQGSSTPKSEQYLKDLSDLPLRVYTSSIGLFDTRALLEKGTYYAEFIEYIRAVSEDLLSMAENIRASEQKPVVAPPEQPKSFSDGRRTIKPTPKPIMDGEPYEGDPDDIPFKD